MAAQLTLTKGPSLRRLKRWTARATNSLPVPVSPKISTVASLGATVVHLIENLFKGGTVADDFSEGTIGADLAFEIFFLFHQTLFQDFDLSRSSMVLQRHSQLGGKLLQQRQVFGVECVLAGAAENKDA